MERRSVIRPVLEKYLREHALASQMCLRYLGLICHQWRNTELGPALAQVYEQVRDDHNDLRAIMGRLGFEEITGCRVRIGNRCLSDRFSTIKMGIPPTLAGNQMQMDAVCGLLCSKLAMWNTLLSLVTSEDRLNPVELISLAERSQWQINQVHSLISQMRPEQFTYTQR